MRLDTKLQSSLVLVRISIVVLCLVSFIGGVSSASADQTTTSPNPLPSSLLFPNNLFAIPITANQINLEWPRVDRADGYVIYRSLDNKTFTSLTVDASHLMFADGGLMPSTTYYYKVTAQRLGTETQASPVITITTFSGSLLPPPQSLVGEYLVTSSRTMIVLNWNQLGPTLPQYTVYRKVDLSDFTSLTTTAVGVNTYTDDNLGAISANTTFYYRVAAKNSQGEGLTSRAVYIRPLGSTSLGAISPVEENSLASIGSAGESMSDKVSYVQFKNTQEVYDARKLMNFSYLWTNTTSDRRFVMRRRLLDDSGNIIFERKTYVYTILPEKSRTLYVGDWLYVKGKKLAPGSYSMQVDVLKYPYKNDEESKVDTNSFNFQVL